MSVLKRRLIAAIHKGEDPRKMLNRIGLPIDIPPDISAVQLWSSLFHFADHLERSNDLAYNRPIPPRQYISSITDIFNLIQNSERIVVVIGAGASVGPDFRSPGGLYETIENSGALEDPYQVFDVDYFTKDPSVFWRFAHLIFPSINPDHSHAHFFLSELEKRGKLLRLYSQNVDTLEVGIPDSKMQCVHGSWRTNKCMSCGEIHTMEDLRENVSNHTVPKCKKCQVGLIKPGIVFFGQQTHINNADIQSDSKTADLLLVIGTSLRVAPVSYIPQLMHKIPTILINREPVTCPFSAELLGDCDPIVDAFQKHFGWETPYLNEKNLKKVRNIEDFQFIEPNKFVLPREDGMSVGFVGTGRSTFIISPSFTGIDSFE